MLGGGIFREFATKVDMAYKTSIHQLDPSIKLASGLIIEYFWLDYVLSKGIKTLSHGSDKGFYGGSSYLDIGLLNFKLGLLHKPYISKKNTHFYKEYSWDKKTDVAIMTVDSETESNEPIARVSLLLSTPEEIFRVKYGEMFNQEMVPIKILATL